MHCKMVNSIPGLYSLEFEVPEESQGELSNSWLAAGVWVLRRQFCLCFLEQAGGWRDP